MAKSSNDAYLDGYQRLNPPPVTDVQAQHNYGAGERRRLDEQRQAEANKRQAQSSASSAAAQGAGEGLGLIVGFLRFPLAGAIAGSFYGYGTIAFCVLLIIPLYGVYTSIKEQFFPPPPLTPQQERERELKNYRPNKELRKKQLEYIAKFTKNNPKK